MWMLILSTFLYACESWNLTAEIERRIQALEMRCYRRLLNISYKDHVTNEEVRNRIQNAIGVHDDLLTMVKKRKLRWYGHISRSSGMVKTILQGTVKGARRGRQKKRWEDNIKEWTGMGFGDSLRAAEDREGCKGIVAMSSMVPRWPPRLRDWDEMRWTSSQAENLKYWKLSHKSTIMILSFRTDRSMQIVQTQIRVYTVCHSVCSFRTHYTKVKPLCSTFRVITANFSVVRIFRNFTVILENPECHCFVGWFKGN